MLQPVERAAMRHSGNDRIFHNIHHPVFALALPSAPHDFATRDNPIEG
jgi:hypothetical protein